MGVRWLSVDWRCNIERVDCVKIVNKVVVVYELGVGSGRINGKTGATLLLTFDLFPFFSRCGLYLISLC